MKTKYLLIILSWMVVIPGFTQISKIKTFDGSIGIENNYMKETKLFRFNGDEMEIYNYDFRLHKKISLENLFNGIYTDFRQINTAPATEQFFTQTLFNDDDLLEFFVEGEGCFAIVNENGEILYREDVSKGSLYSTDFYVIEISSKVYLRMINDYDDFTSFYEITKNASDTRTLTLKQSASFPNPAKEYINIAYDLQGIPDGVLHVFDMQGKQITEEKISGNETSFRLDTNAFQSGMYVVSISSEGKQLSSEKILVE